MGISRQRSAPPGDRRAQVEDGTLVVLGQPRPEIDEGLRAIGDALTADRGQPLGSSRSLADTGDPGSRPSTPLVRDPGAWLVAALVAFASVSCIRQALGLGVLPEIAALGGPGTVIGAIAVGAFTLRVARGQVLLGLDRRMAWLLVVASAAYWLMECVDPNGIAAPTGGLPGHILFVAGLGLVPLVVVAMVRLPLVRPSQADVVLFVIDLLIVGFASAMLLWYLVAYPLGHAAGADLGFIIQVTLQPSASLALVFVGIATVRMPVPRVALSAKQLLVVAFGCTFASSLSAAIQVLAPSTSMSTLSSVFQAWFWVVMAGLWIALMRDRSADSDRSTGRIPSFSWLPYVAIAVAFVVPAVRSWGDVALLEQHIPSSGILVVLVLLRLAATARQNAILVASGATLRAEAHFRALVQNSSDLVVRTDANSRVRYVTPSAMKVLGVEPDSLVGRSFSALLHPDDTANCLAVFKEVAAAPGATRQAECRLRRGDGSFCEAEVAVANMLNVPEVAGLVLTVRDIGERKALERELTFQALHDPLTGLANRTLFADRVAHALTRSVRGTGTVAVLFMDLDDFKRINDSQGHGVGDRLLIAVGQRLVGVLRGGDTAARLGGDEFAVLLEDLGNADEARVIAERVHNALLVPIDVGGVEAFVSASIGVALGRRADVDQEELLRNADLAMYVAKANGKGRSETFDPNMHRDARDRLVLEADLRHGVSRDEFEVFYQPMWVTRTRRIVAVEALVRWRHPTRGLLSPEHFISVARETGLIVPIGRFVLREACRQTVAWDRAGGPAAGLSIAVNLSPRQLHEADLVETVVAALADAGLPAERLNLEITEAVLVDDSPSMAELLRRLKGLGVRISIDDFGTGYSSLSYLQRLPIDTLKIAKPFVDVVTNGPKDRALAQAVVALARSMKLEVVAEGIENEKQLHALVGMGCELGQGFLVSPPVRGDGLPAIASRAQGANAA